jgi:hypothetical protein
MQEDSLFACATLVLLIVLAMLLFSGSPETIERASDAALYIIPLLP